MPIFISTCRTFKRFSSSSIFVLRSSIFSSSALRFSRPSLICSKVSSDCFVCSFTRDAASPRSMNSSPTSTCSKAN
eukprot:UN13576